MTQITWGQSTHIGLVRDHNEDTVLSLHFAGNTDESRGNIGLFIVADGMGGKGIGAHASKLVVQAIAENLLGVLLRQTPLALDQDVIANEITEAVQAANLNVLRQAEYGAGSTVSLALITDELVTIGHVGDSAIFQITSQHIEQITHEHTFVYELVRRGHITW